MPYQEEDRILRDIHDHLITPTRNFFAANPIDGWPNGRVWRIGEVKRWGGKFQQLYNDLDQILVTRHNELQQISKDPAKSALHHSGEALLTVNRLIQRLDQFNQEFAEAPLYVRRNQATRPLWAQTRNLEQNLESQRQHFRTLAINEARSAEADQLIQIQHAITSALGNPPPAGAGIAVHNAYRDFLIKQQGSIAKRLTAISSSTYNVEDGLKFTNDLQNSFLQENQKLQKQKQDALRNIQRTTSPAVVAANRNIIDEIDNIQNTTHNPIVNNHINQARSRMLPIANALDVDRRQHSNIRKSFRMASGALTNWREFAAGAATGFLVKTAFCLAASTFASPVVLAVGGAVLAGMANRVMRRVFFGKKLERGWWWKSAAAGAVGGAVGYGLASLACHLTDGWFKGWGGGGSPATAGGTHYHFKLDPNWASNGDHNWASHGISQAAYQPMANPNYVGASTTNIYNYYGYGSSYPRPAYFYNPPTYGVYPGYSNVFYGGGRPRIAFRFGGFARHFHR